MRTSCELTIFEGPDGSGKTTAARKYAEQTGARYVHLGPFPRVSTGLARLYAEAMLPALLGYQAVVLDRCWLSEQPYGVAYRGSADRIGAVYRRMLERLALRCGVVLVRCDPGVETCLANYRTRKALEMLENEEQLRSVHEGYLGLQTELLQFHYDYRNDPVLDPNILANFRTTRHPLDSLCAGDWDARIAIVGEAFGEVKNDDPLYQWPFASFSRNGCSAWVTEQLEQAGIGERNLFWVNVDEVGPGGTKHDAEHIIALGQVAHARLTELGYTHHSVAHPQYWKRFHSDKPYELVTLLKELLK